MSLPVIAAAVVDAVDKENVNPGVLGFVVVALLGVATWLLIRSMTRHLQKVDFEEAGPEEQVGSSDETQTDEHEVRAPGEQL